MILCRFLNQTRAQLWFMYLHFTSLKIAPHFGIAPQSNIAPHHDFFIAPHLEKVVFIKEFNLREVCFHFFGEDIFNKIKILVEKQENFGSIFANQ